MWRVMSTTGRTFGVYRTKDEAVRYATKLAKFESYLSERPTTSYYVESILKLDNPKPESKPAPRTRWSAIVEELNNA